MAKSRRSRRQRRKATVQRFALEGLFAVILILGTVKAADLVVSGVSFPEEDLADPDRAVVFGITPSDAELQGFSFSAANLQLCPRPDGTTEVTVFVAASSSAIPPPEGVSLAVLAPADASDARQFTSVRHTDLGTGAIVEETFSEIHRPLSAESFGRWSVIEMPLTNGVVLEFVNTETGAKSYKLMWGVSFETRALRYSRSGIGRWQLRLEYDIRLSTYDMDPRFEALSPPKEDPLGVLLCEENGTQIREVLPEDFRPRPTESHLGRSFTSFEVEAEVSGGMVRSLSDAALPILVVLVPIWVGLWFLEIEGWSGRTASPLSVLRAALKSRVSRYRRGRARRRKSRERSQRLRQDS